MLNKKTSKQKGFTFTELMIAMSLNSFLFVALIAIFVAGLTHYNTIFQTNLLYTQMHSAMDLMITDIRRAGYWSLASSMIGTNANTNPFQASGNDVSIGSGNNCILFTYDHTNAGSLPTISASYDDLRYGYRLSSGAIQSRPAGAVFACNAAANNWTNITDPNAINISNLNFSLSSQVITVGSHAITIRYITISLTGSVVGNSTISETLTESVRIANDLYT